MSGAKQVGILAAEIYFPKCYVDQRDLEKHDGVSEGKYTIGLGQHKMATVTDREDINSLALSAFDRLCESYAVDLKMVGRLEVGTETLVDKSKSVKTYLMQRFEEVENFDVEGVDNKNACYGGTQALMNTINWIESSSWDGRLGIVVCADIAVYAAGPARPTGGAGAVALLVGPNAPLEVSPVKQNYFRHAFDFYKPDLTSEYPIVDGALSIKQYYEALDRCYQGWRSKAKNVHDSTRPHQVFEGLDYVCFHSPFSKLVQKSFGRLMYNDLITCPESLLKLIGKENFDTIERFRNVTFEDALADKELERAFVQVSKSAFAERCEPTLLVSQNVGNMYTPSLYGCLISLIAQVNLVAGNRIGMFSYGSGCSATFYTIQVHQSEALEQIKRILKAVPVRLEQRNHVSPAQMESNCSMREAANKLKRDQLSDQWQPAGPIAQLEPGTAYLERIDQKWRRFYAVHADVNGNL